MPVTVTTAAARDHRMTRRAQMRLSTADLVLLAVSFAAVAAIAATYAGRSAVLARSAPGPALVVNLNTMADATGLEAAFAAVFEHAGDRRFAARELFGFVVPS